MIIFSPLKEQRPIFQLQQAGGLLQGDASYTQYAASLYYYYPLPLSVVFGVKGRIGYIQGHDGGEIPIFTRYVLGGINSLRGFRYIGPTNPGTEDVIGGTTMLVFNVELVFPFIKESGYENSYILRRR